MTAEELREGWRAVAAGWERQRAAMWETTRPVSERLVELLAPEPGDTVLELAGGSGDTGLLAAERVGPSGRVIESDFVPEIVDSARRRAAEVGAENVEFRVLDAESLDLADESVDGVLCRWGFMLTSDMATAFAETARVLRRPDGRVAFAVWGTPEENAWASTVGRVLVEHGLAPPPAPDGPGPFRLGDRSRVRELVEGAGLELVSNEDFPITFRHRSFDDFWETTQDVSRAVQTALESADSDTIAGVKTELADRFAAFEDEGGALTVPGVTQVVLAHHPA
ncbi:MAG TPA: methyltransferase domain-containing protein [Gaiellaceae bacterium]|nr:methyltransferase domain-containing protein [Gaiellaceae bacterium]